MAIRKTLGFCLLGLMLMAPAMYSAPQQRQQHKGKRKGGGGGKKGGSKQAPTKSGTKG